MQSNSGFIKCLKDLLIFHIKGVAQRLAETNFSQSPLIPVDTGSNSAARAHVDKGNNAIINRSGKCIVCRAHS